jgi:23S rRNA (cytosine1962-C5)-methyltransferase
MRPTTKPQEEASRSLRHTPGEDAFAALRNRLHKSFRHWSRWARRQGVGAYRFYDRDIPEFPLAIDSYVPADTTLGRRLHLQEYDTGWQQSPQEHARWLHAVRLAASHAAGVLPDHVIVKVRPRRHAGAQHEKRAARGEEFEILESGLRFRVNLEAYVDTGLFPDHRAMRALVRTRAAGRRMLNLFAYTGSFTVYAAAGGAASSDSVDLSNTYLEWAARNFASNGMDRARHRLIRADVLQWLDDARGEGRRYDLVVLDAPAFSNSKAMSGVLDVQRDHAALIAGALRLLAPGGELYFSTNLRTFALDEALAQASGCTDLTHATRAPDFRDPRVHRAFRFTVPAKERS